MEKLTDKQNEIIEQLKSEFVKINEKPQKSSGLISIETIKKEVSDKNNWLKEINVIQTSWKELVKEHVKKDLASIQEDLKALNLVGKAGNHSIEIGIIGREEERGRSVLILNYRDYRYEEYVKFGIKKEVYKGFVVNIKPIQCLGNQFYKDIDFKECVSSDEFKKRIKSLYEQSL